MGSIPVISTFTAVATTTAMMNKVKSVADFWAGPPCCSCYQTSVTSIAYSAGLTSGTAVAFDTEVFDVANSYDGGGDSPHHDNSTQNTRLYARTTGKYRISGQVQFANAAGGNRVAQVRLNAAGSYSGGTLLRQNTQGALTGGSTSCAISAFIYPLNAGDYIEIFGAQNQTSASALNTVAGLGNTVLELELAAS